MSELRPDGSTDRPDMISWYVCKGFVFHYQVFITRPMKRENGKDSSLWLQGRLCILPIGLSNLWSYIYIFWFMNQLSFFLYQPSWSWNTVGMYHVATRLKDQRAQDPRSEVSGYMEQGHDATGHGSASSSNSVHIYVTTLLIPRQNSTDALPSV